MDIHYIVLQTLYIRSQTIQVQKKFYCELRIVFTYLCNTMILLLVVWSIYFDKVAKSHFFILITNHIVTNFFYFSYNTLKKGEI